MTHRFNGQENAHELARHVFPVMGSKVWCRAPQSHEHLATVVRYKNNFSQVLVKWDWDTGIHWKDGSWIDVRFVRHCFTEDPFNLRDTPRVNYSED